MSDESNSAQTWELWESETDGDTFFPADNTSARNLLAADARLVWTCTADSYNKAMQLMYDYRGWGTYKPIP